MLSRLKDSLKDKAARVRERLGGGRHDGDPTKAAPAAVKASPAPIKAAPTPAMPAPVMPAPVKAAFAPVKADPPAPGTPADPPELTANETPGEAPSGLSPATAPAGIPSDEASSKVVSPPSLAPNGISTNGVSTNGVSTSGTNGVSTSGVSTSGVSTNGVSANGVSANGVSANGAPASARPATAASHGHAKASQAPAQASEKAASEPVPKPTSLAAAAAAIAGGGAPTRLHHADMGSVDIDAYIARAKANGRSVDAIRGSIGLNTADDGATFWGPLDNPSSRSKAAGRMLTVDQVECISCGTCVEQTDKVFFLPDDGKATPIAQDGPMDLIEDAIEACPVTCIHWVPPDEATARGLATGEES